MSATLITPAQPQRALGQGLMIAGGLILGTLGIFVEEAGASPLVATGARSALGLAALTAFAVASGQWTGLSLSRSNRWVAAVAGLLMALNWTLFFAAIAKTSIAVATIVFHVQPFLIMAWGAVVLGERVGLLRLMAAVAALVGLVLASGLVGLSSLVDMSGIDGASGHFAGLASAPTLASTQDPAPGPTDNLVGVLLALGGSVSYAAVTLIARSRRDIPALTMAWWQCLMGTLLIGSVLIGAMLIGTAATPGIGDSLDPGWPPKATGWLWLAGLGVIHTGLAYVLLYGGIARLSATRVALLQFVYPVSAILFEAIVYGRTMGGSQLVGVVLMLGALAVCTLGADASASPRSALRTKASLNASVTSSASASRKAAERSGP